MLNKNSKQNSMAQSIIEPIKKLQTGIPGFDHVSQGGLP
jgi:hypothetical protein